jgi:outer membrane protein
MKKTILYLICLSVSISVSAQEIWTLESCVYKAVEQNINVKQSELGLQNAEINEKLQRHARNPSLNANTGANWSFGRSINPVTNQFETQTFFSNNLSLNTGVTLFNFGKIKNNIKQSEVNRAAAKEDHQQLINDISLQVASTYLNGLFAQENKRISENQLVLSGNQLAQVNKLINAGVLPANEALQVEAQMALDKQNIIGAQNNYDIAIIQLKQLLREENAEQIILEAPEEIEIATDPMLVTFDELYKSALTRQRSIQAGLLREKSAEMGIKIAKADKYPNLGAGGSVGTNYANNVFQQDGYTTQIKDNLSYGFGFNLGIPIYNNNAVNANVQRSELAVTNAQLETANLRENLKTQLQQNLSDARAAKLQYEASEASFESQNASFLNSEKQYNLGVINTFEYLTAKNLLDSAEINKLISKYDYIFKVKILEFYLGKPLKLK